jgi:hypothetical protein
MCAYRSQFPCSNYFSLFSLYFSIFFLFRYYYCYHLPLIFLFPFYSLTDPYYSLVNLLRFVQKMMNNNDMFFKMMDINLIMDTCILGNLAAVCILTKNLQYTRSYTQTHIYIDEEDNEDDDDVVVVISLPFTNICQQLISTTLPSGLSTSDRSLADGILST